MISKRQIGFAVFVLMATQASWVSAQDNQVWMRTRLSAELVPDLELSYDQQFKWMERAVQLDRWQHTVSLDYKLTRWLEMGAGYRVTAKPSDRDAEDVCCKHRPTLDVTGKLKSGKLRLSLRVRGQALFADGDATRWTSRTRAKAAFKVASWARPYVSAETFLLPVDGWSLESQRFDAGTRWDLVEGLRLKTYLRRELITDSEDATIAGLNLDYSW